MLSGDYSKTPASDILHELARLKLFGVTTFQAEEEIVGIGAALGVKTTSGPGLSLKFRRSTIPPATPRCSSSAGVGTDGCWAVARRGFGLGLAPTAEGAPEDVVVHDPADHEPAFALSRLSDLGLDHSVFGVLRQVAPPTYDDLTRAQVEERVDGGGRDLLGLLPGRDTWTVRNGTVLTGTDSSDG